MSGNKTAGVHVFFESNSKGRVALIHRLFRRGKPKLARRLSSSVYTRSSRRHLNRKRQRLTTMELDHEPQAKSIRIAISSSDTRGSVDIREMASRHSHFLWMRRPHFLCRIRRL